MSQYTHARAVQEATHSLLTLKVQFGGDLNQTAAAIMKMRTPCENLEKPSAETVFRWTIGELAAAMNHVTDIVKEDGKYRLVPRENPNPYRLISYKNLERSGLAPSGGLSLSQRYAACHFPALMAPNLALAHVLSPSSRMVSSIQWT